MQQIDIALDPCSNIYVDGISALPWNGPGGQAPLHAFSGGGGNIVAIKMANAVPPTISSFSPTSGGSWTEVTITGTGFTPNTAVTFGRTAASSIVLQFCHPVDCRYPQWTRW